MNSKPSQILLLLAGALICFSEATSNVFGQTVQPIDTGNQRELFIDDYLISEMKNVQLLVHPPVREVIAVTCDAPWKAMAADTTPSCMTSRNRFTGPP
jgi:hypothetical protein